MRVRRRLLGHDSDIRRVEQLPQPLVADPALEGDDVPHGHVFDLLDDGVGRLPAAEDDDAQVGQLGLEDACRLDDRVLSVAILDRAVADDREPAVVGLVGRRLPVAEHRLGVGAVEDDRDPLRLRSPLHVALLELVGDGDRVVGEAQDPLLDPREHLADSTGPEDALRELGARLVHVRDDPASEELRERGGEHEEVGHRVHLDHRVRAADVPRGERCGGQHEERRVVEHVAELARLAELARERAHGDAVDHLAALAVRAAHVDQLDVVAGAHERLRLAADGQLVVVRLADDADARALPAAGVPRPHGLIVGSDG